MISQEIKKYMFENCPEYWGKYTRKEISEEYLINMYRLMKKLERAKNEEKQSFLEPMSKYLKVWDDWLTEEFESNLIDGHIRTERLTKLKELLIESLINTSMLTYNAPNEYKDIFKQEILRIYNYQ